MRKTLKRALLLISACLAIAAPATALSGCGATGHYVAAVAAHHVLNHVVGRRNANRIFCLYHGHRVLVDVRNHHYFAAGLNGLAAYHACRGGFGKG